MLFVSVYRTTGMNLRLNGVLGLSPGSTNVMLSNGDSITNSFIEQLYSKNLIDSRVFSLSLSNTNEKSVFTAGGYDVERYGKDDH